jgi:hypothetical protein
MDRKKPVLEQIERKRAEDAREMAIRAIGNILSTADGKVALAYLIAMTGYFAPELLDASSKIYANVANRDLGARMLTLMGRANGQAVLDIQKDQWHRAVAEEIENEKLLSKES